MQEGQACVCMPPELKLTSRIQFGMHVGESGAPHPNTVVSMPTNRLSQSGRLGVAGARRL